MSEEIPEITTDLICPVRKKLVEVTLEINTFRCADHEGINVTACSEFLQCNGIPYCGKECLHTEEAHDIHQEEVYKHQGDRSHMGPNTVGWGTTER